MKVLTNLKNVLSGFRFKTDKTSTYFFHNNQIFCTLDTKVQAIEIDTCFDDAPVLHQIKAVADEHDYSLMLADYSDIDVHKEDDIFLIGE